MKWVVVEVVSIRAVEGAGDDDEYNPPTPLAKGEC